MLVFAVMTRTLSQSGDSEVGCMIAFVIFAAAGYLGWEVIHNCQEKGVALMGRDCPFGAELAGDHPPKGTAEWCQRKNDRGDYVRYGPFRVWTQDGRLFDSGYYDGEGLPHRDIGPWPK